MGRPRLYDDERTVTAIRLPNSLKKRLTEEAGARMVSLNYIVIRALERYLDEMPPADGAVR